MSRHVTLCTWKWFCKLNPSRNDTVRENVTLHCNALSIALCKKIMCVLTQMEDFLLCRMYHFGLLYKCVVREYFNSAMQFIYITLSLHTNNWTSAIYWWSLHLYFNTNNQAVHCELSLRPLPACWFFYEFLWVLHSILGRYSPKAQRELVSYAVGLHITYCVHFFKLTGVASFRGSWIRFCVWCKILIKNLLRNICVYALRLQ